MQADLRRLTRFVSTVLAGLVFLMSWAMSASADTPTSVTVRTYTGAPVQNAPVTFHAVTPGGQNIDFTHGTAASGQVINLTSIPTGSQVTATAFNDPVDASSGCRDGFQQTFSKVTYVQGDVAQTLTLARAIPELTEPAMNDVERRFIDLVNQERAKVGAPALSASDTYAEIADAGATAIDTHLGCTGQHRGVIGEYPTYRAAEFTGTAGIAEVVTPNAISSDCSATDLAVNALESFRSSAPHWAILTDPWLRAIGVALVDSVLVANLSGADRGLLSDLPPMPRLHPSSRPANSCAGTPPTTKASLTASASPARVTSGSMIRLHGHTTPNGTVQIAASARIAPASTTVTADASGAYQAAVRVRTTTKFTVRHEGDADVSLTVQARARVQARAHMTGRKTRVSGTLAPGLAGRKVTVKIGSASRTVRTTSGGQFTVVLRSVKQARRASIVVPGTADYIAVKATVTVR